MKRLTRIEGRADLRSSGRVVEFVEAVDRLDGKGLVPDVALLLLVVHVYFDIGDMGVVGGCLGGVCGGGRMVIKGIEGDCGRYTVEGAVGGGVGAVEGGGSRVWGMLRVVHDGA
jgi:hypothetical protein